MGVGRLLFDKTRPLIGVKFFRFFVANSCCLIESEWGYYIIYETCPTLIGTGARVLNIPKILIVFKRIIAGLHPHV